MVKPSTKKDTAGPSMSSGISASSYAPSRRPRLTKKNVINAILLLGDTRGSTMQSILTKLRHRPGGEDISRVQLEKAIDRLMEDNLVKKVKEERFLLFAKIKESAVEAQNTTRTRTASAVSSLVVSVTGLKHLSARITKAADVKTSTPDASANKTRHTKASAVAVRAGRGRKSSSTIDSNNPRKADRDRIAGSLQKVVNKRLHEKPRGAISDKTDVKVVDTPPKGSHMEVDAEADSSPFGVNETSAAATGDKEVVHITFMEPMFGPNAKLPPPWYQI